MDSTKLFQLRKPELNVLTIAEHTVVSRYPNSWPNETWNLNLAYP